MKYIKKDITPKARQALATFIRLEKNKAHYNNFKQSDGKGDVQESLLKEQGFLCAYCMRRIVMPPKIEHWVTREKCDAEKMPLLTLDYDNLLAVCDGTTPTNGQIDEHCDQSRSKSNRELTINPTNGQLIQQLKFLKNGTIESNDKDISEDINQDKALNLNALFLRDARRNVYESVKKLIDIKCRKATTPVQAQKIISEIVEDWSTKKINADGQLQFKEYCAIVPYFFKKYAS
jgi:uncharacterized protein (TIGR02646 family)